MQRRLGRSSIKVRRDKVVIATKFGNLFDEQSKQITGTDVSPEFIRRACDASLKRLGTDYIDLYQFHLNDCEAEKAGEVREVPEALAGEGKIRFYGWSTDYPRAGRGFCPRPVLYGCSA